VLNISTSTQQQAVKLLQIGLPFAAACKVVKAALVQ